MHTYGNEENFVSFQKSNVSKFISNIGILSLCHNKENILMWSHYADDHKGLVFEFNPTGNQSSALWFPYEVKYKEEYELLSYAVDEEENRRQITELILSKYIDWEYEDEYRVIDLKYHGEKKFMSHELRKVVFGAKADDSKIYDFIKLCQDNDVTHVVFEKARLVPGQFALEFEKVEG